jgi:hypothetical protein
MTRQEELNEAWCKYRGKCSTEIIQALAFALKWADAHHHWTSVEDELPKENGRYLFYHELVIRARAHHPNVAFPGAARCDTCLWQDKPCRKIITKDDQHICIL